MVTTERRRAILAVHDTTGIDQLAVALDDSGYELYVSPETVSAVTSVKITGELHDLLSDGPYDRLAPRMSRNSVGLYIADLIGRSADPEDDLDVAIDLVCVNLSSQITDDRRIGQRPQNNREGQAILQAAVDTDLPTPTHYFQYQAVIDVLRSGAEFSPEHRAQLHYAAELVISAHAEALINDYGQYAGEVSADIST